MKEIAFLKASGAQNDRSELSHGPGQVTITGSA
jgi:hypothetical protein